MFTSVGIHFNRLPEFEAVLNVLPFDTLDAQGGERAQHVLVVDHHCAHAFLAALLSHQIVRMGPIGLVFGHTRHHHHCLSSIIAHLIDSTE